MSASIIAGRLNCRITIQQPGTTQDGLGQPITGWTTLATVWANIKHLSGVEAVKAQTDSSTVKASIRIRYRASIDAGMRVVHGESTYDIKAVLPDEVRREHVDLVCERVQ